MNPEPLSAIVGAGAGTRRRRRRSRLEEGTGARRKAVTETEMGVCVSLVEENLWARGRDRLHR